MAVDKSGSKTDTVVKLVLVFFVCLLSFSIGAFVGKKFSDNQHKLAKFEPEANNNQERDVASIHPEAGEMKPHDALTDDEVAKLAEEFVADDAGGEKKKDEAHPAKDQHAEENVHTAKAEEADGHGGGHGEAKASAHGEAKAPAHGAEKAAARTTQSVEPLKPATKAVEKQDRIPSSLPKEVAASPVGKFTVQLASYQTEAEAKKKAGELKGQQYSAFYVAAKIKDRKTNEEKTWYRVCVGLFSTSKEAETYKDDLMARAKLSSAIVQKITE